MLINNLVFRRVTSSTSCLIKRFIMTGTTLGQDEVASMRIDYKVSNIDDEQIPSKDPFKWFDIWFNEAVNHSQVTEANSMNIATSTRDGRVSARMVLLKGVTERGFRFFTNHGSEKGRQLKENPYAALTFYWEPLQKQVRINGCIERLSDEESTKYFHSRPFASQIGALVSEQSTVIPNRQFLESKRIELTEKYEGKVVPKPDFWGGYLLVPESFEFWCGGSGRLHDRIRFRHLCDGETIDETLSKQADNGWIYERLSP